MNTERSTGSAVDVAALIMELQSVGLRIETELATPGRAAPDRPTPGCCGSRACR